MRCLHCGKELAVFKRLARQEFCSDIHRREYREKYDQLALGRLLEEKSPETGPQSTPKKSKGPITLGLSDAGEMAPSAPAPADPATETLAPETLAPEIPAPEIPTPKTLVSQKGVPERMAGIMMARLIPNAIQMTTIIKAETELTPTVAPEQPQRRFEPPPATSRRAGPVRFVPAVPIRSSPDRANEHRLEVRGFTRIVPVVHVHLDGSAPAQLEGVDKALEVRMEPQCPAREPVLWHAPSREFAPCRIESESLGEPARPERDAHRQSGVAIPEAPVSDAPVTPAAVIEAAVHEAATVEAAIRDPAVVEPPAAEPHAIPERVTRPMPVTLHGVAAGRARPVQVFSALPGQTSLQAPRYDALPLRTMMILGPAVKREIAVPEVPLSPPMKSGLSRIVKATAGVVAGLALALGFFFVKGNSGTAASAPLVEAGPPLPSAPDDWLQNFSPDGKRQRRISLLRASGDLTDYRVEFESSIQSKAVGWVYRAKDPLNFYVSKLEVQKPGMQPAVLATHYAVINGEDLAQTRVPLPSWVVAEAVYKIRFQAAGNHFTTWVQDQKVDDWTDDRIKAGGAGLYSEDGEHAPLRSSFKVVPLIRRNR